MGGQVRQSISVSVISSLQLVLAASQDSPHLPHPGNVLELWGEDTVGGDDGLEEEKFSSLDAQPDTDLISSDQQLQKDCG